MELSKRYVNLYLLQSREKLNSNSNKKNIVIF